MRVIPIVSAIIIVIGCFMPWIQLGALFTYRGIDGPDGAVMLVASVIAGAVAFYNQSKNQTSNTWVYIVVGILGLIVAYMDLNEVKDRAEKIADGLGQLNNLFGNDQNISSWNFIGSGLYIIAGGSVGLLLSGLGVFKESSQPTSNEEKKLTDIAAPKYAKKVVQEKTEEEIANEQYQKGLVFLHTEIKKQQGKMFGGGMTEEILNEIDKFCETRDDAIYFLNSYNDFFKTDLIDDLKKLNSSYDAIRQNVSKFIELDLIEEKFPHAPKN